jgi:hypothetical protein
VIDADGPPVIVAVGGPEPSAPGSQARACSECGALAYFSKAGRAAILAQAKGGPVRWICLGCVDAVPAPSDLQIAPYTQEQVAEIHAAGYDFSAEQIQGIVQEIGGELLRGRGKP